MHVACSMVCEDVVLSEPLEEGRGTEGEDSRLGDAVN